MAARVVAASAAMAWVEVMGALPGCSVLEGCRQAILTPGRLHRLQRLPQPPQPPLKQPPRRGHGPSRNLQNPSQSQSSGHPASRSLLLAVRPPAQGEGSPLVEGVQVEAVRLQGAVAKTMSAAAAVSMAAGGAPMGSGAVAAPAAAWGVERATVVAVLPGSSLRLAHPIGSSRPAGPHACSTSPARRARPCRSISSAIRNRDAGR